MFSAKHIIRSASQLSAVNVLRQTVVGQVGLEASDRQVTMPCICRRTGVIYVHIVGNQRRDEQQRSELTEDGA